MQFRRTLFSLFAAISIVLLAGSVALAQVEAGSITGTVKDPSGAVIPNATVTVRNLNTGAQRTVQTGSVGQYTISGLPVGTYEVTVTSPNFATYKTNAEVTVGGVSTVDVAMSTGQTTTTVEVVAGLGGTSVNTQSQELSQLVDTQQMAQLPSLTRNPYDFVQISGNVSNGDNTSGSMNSSQNSTSRGVGYAINGQRESGSEILLDGVENIDIFNAEVGQQVPVDSVQEYRVITNNFDAQYGRAAGGVVNVTTKSGTNAFHGGAWEFNRLSAYTANTYQDDSLNALHVLSGAPGPLPAPKGVYTRNQFGFEIGGPVIKNKLFFYGSTEWTRVRGGAYQTELIPTPQFLSFTAPNVQSYFNTYGHTTYPITTTYAQSDLGVTIPGVPAATPILGQVSFRAGDAGGDYPQNTYTLMGRADFNATENTQMFFRYARENLNEFPGAAFYSAYPQYDVGQNTLDDSYLYSLNHTFGPSMISSTKVSFSRLNPLQATYNLALQSTPGLMFTGATAQGLAVQFPGLENFMAPGAGGLPFGGPQNTVQLEEDLAKTRGNHSMHFGGQFTYIQLNKAYGAYAQAVEVLGNGLGPGLNAMMPAPGSSDAILEYYEAAVNPQGHYPCPANPDGTLNTSVVNCNITLPATAPSFSRSYRYKDWAVYGQDSWKVTPRLTFNYGLRYEHYGVQHNVNPNLDSNFYLGAGSNFYQRLHNGQVFLAPRSPVGGLWAPDWGTAAPRVGFAYDVFGDGRTSLRGGFGISYERNFGNVTFNVIQNVPNYAVLEAFSATSPVPVTTSNIGPFGGTGTAPLPPTELRMPNPHINTAQTQFWGLSLERQVARNTVLELSYNGAHGVHLYDITVANPLGGGQVYLGEPLSCASCLTRPNQQYAGINIRGSGGTSSYNALNVRLQTQDLHNTGLTMVANYTYAHSLDDLSSTFSDNAQGGSGYIGNLGYMEPTHPKLDWGSSDFDVRNRLTLSPIWETPWFKNGTGFLHQLFGGYSLVGIVSARTGTPFSAFDYTYNINGYFGVPRIVPSTPITSFAVGAPVNTGAPNSFQVLTIPGANDLAPFNPTLGIDDFGPFPANMTRRNAFRGPGAWNTDLAASKSFSVTERVKLTFRAEGFDIFNHHNLYVNESGLSVSNTPGTIGSPLPVIALKGGLNSIALGGNHDERRFGQFSLRVSF